MAAKTLKYPTKTTLNLIVKERSSVSPKGWALFFVALLIIALFAKFAVYDRFAYAHYRQGELNSTTTRLAQLQKTNEEFFTVQSEYKKYFTVGALSETYADCMDVLTLVEENLMGSASVRSISLNESAISVVLTEITLDQASGILTSLYENPLVESAVLHVAEAPTDGTTTTVSMTIQLKVSEIAAEEQTTAGGTGEGGASE